MKPSTISEDKGSGQVCMRLQAIHATLPLPPPKRALTEQHGQCIQHDESRGGGQCTGHPPQGHCHANVPYHIGEKKEHPPRGHGRFGDGRLRSRPAFIIAPAPHLRTRTSANGLQEPTDGTLKGSPTWLVVMFPQDRQHARNKFSNLCISSNTFLALPISESSSEV